MPDSARSPLEYVAEPDDGFRAWFGAEPADEAEAEPGLESYPPEAGEVPAAWFAAEPSAGTTTEGGFEPPGQAESDPEAILAPLEPPAVPIAWFAAEPLARSPLEPQPASEATKRSLQAHLNQLRSMVRVLSPLGTGLLDAAGLTLQESITADLDLPTFTSATVDGWAVRASNLVGASSQRPVIMPVMEVDRHHGYRGEPLSPGMAAFVNAGDPVPDGSDAVVPAAEGERVEMEVQFVEEARFHQNLKLAGARVADGDLLLRAGAELTPGAIGLLAEVGFDKVLTRPRPRVIVMTADDSLVEPGRPLSLLTQRYDACTTMLTSAARADGAQVFPVGLVNPEPTALGEAIHEQLLRADLVLLVAQASEDLVAVLAADGQVDQAEVDPLPNTQMFARVGSDRVPLLVLPPEPVAAYLGYLLLVRPLLGKLTGQDGLHEPLQLELAVEAVRHPTRSTLVPGRRVDGTVTALIKEDLSMSDLINANALILVPPGPAPLPAHARVSCWLFD